MAAVLTQGATEHPGPLHQPGDDADGDDAERDQQVAIAVMVGFTCRISSLNMRLGMVS